MSDLHNRIMNILSRGPALLIDIAETIDRDSMQTAAILDYFVGTGEIKKTVRRYGTSPVYFIEKDRDAAVDKLIQTLNGGEKELVAKIKEEGAVKVPDMSPAERYISQNLQDFVKRITAQDDQTGEKVEYVYYYSLDLGQLKALINKQTNPKKQPQKQERAQAQTVRKPVKKEPELDDRAGNILLTNHFDSPVKVGKDLYLCEYGPHGVHVVVQIISKDKLSSKDFMKIVGYATMHKTIAFIITNAEKITGEKKFGNTLNIVRTNT